MKLRHIVALHAAANYWCCFLLLGTLLIVMATKSKNWSGKVTKESHALDLEEGIFTWTDPKKIARSLKESAEQSKRRKSEPFRSAMSMLVFYINRAGRKLDPKQKKILEQAKQELRILFNRQ